MSMQGSTPLPMPQPPKLEPPSLKPPLPALGAFDQGVAEQFLHLRE